MALVLARAVVVVLVGEEAADLEKYPARRRPAKRVRRGEDAAAARSGRGWDLERPEWSMARPGSVGFWGRACGARGFFKGNKITFCQDSSIQTYGCRVPNIV